MKVSGFTFIRNAQLYGYPIVQSIKSILPICDEYIVNVGESEDGTLEMIESIGDPKIKTIVTKWNEKMSDRGFVYGQQKTIAHYSCTGDWAFYLEGDEVVHEDDLQGIYASLERHRGNPEVEALVFDYVHFYGNHATCLDTPAFYRRAPRVIRNSIRAYSPDGMFFVVLMKNKKGRYPKAALAGAKIYHYGWVRSEEQMNVKGQDICKYWGKEHERLVYADIDPAKLREFTGSHPGVMKGWLPEEPAEFRVSENYRLTLKDWKYRMKKTVEDALGLDLCKKHFRIVA